MVTVLSSGAKQNTYYMYIINMYFAIELTVDPCIEDCCKTAEPIDSSLLTGQ
jgi:hypothetical protein